MSGNATLDFVQQKCLEVAEALESRFTPTREKRAAATILRNIVAVQPHCSFCGTGSGKWRDLYPSTVKPTTWICDGCAMYVAIYLVHPGRTSEVRHERWLESKDLAP
jgi:hypothetical protein